MFSKENSKKIITGLLFVSCVISGIILAATPANPAHRIESGQQLDSLINTHLTNEQISPEQLRTSVIRIDTSFVRKDLRIRVPSHFSKTLFHVGLHKDLRPYNIEAPAVIKFPSRDMHIYISHKGTVLRTLRMTSDPDLDSLSTQ